MIVQGWIFDSVEIGQYLRSHSIEIGQYLRFNTTFYFTTFTGDCIIQYIPFQLFTTIASDCISHCVCGCIVELKTLFSLILLLMLWKIGKTSMCYPCSLYSKKDTQNVRLHFNKTAILNAIKNFQNYGTSSDIGRSWHPWK